MVAQTNFPAINVLVFIVGAIFLLIGLLGSGIESNYFKISPLSRVVRIVVFVIGAGFVVLGIILSKPDWPKSDGTNNTAHGDSPDKYGAIAFSESTHKYGYGIDYLTR